ncbi:hypothetical protein ASG67_04790 [Sphingomonas sp. Leaf339]|uniref:hypothetical protein n=1 Tax=Sphingomonas sp. Leaf339 TaxID=1736343 RepID=UPI0006FA387A|nr:hypothetical protein [Sphingomonas sp. Leaf339]KQU62407.1 hypothetical protein ASG67_04790 [Sphingomonas sp. Leaf339]
MRLIAAATLMLPLVPAFAAEKPVVAPKTTPVRCAGPVAAKMHSGSLASMPNATEIKALNRTMDGCNAPMVGRTDLGSNKSADADRPNQPFTITPSR